MRLLLLGNSDTEEGRRPVIYRGLSVPIASARVVAAADGAQVGRLVAAAGTLMPKSRAHYQWALDHHLTELADEPLSALDVPRLNRHRRQLLDGGRSLNTVRAVMAKLSGILQIAAEDGLITGNPCARCASCPHRRATRCARSRPPRSRR